MKILPNAIPAVKVYANIRHLNAYRKRIDKAREAGDFEKEREYINAALISWSTHLLDAFNVKVNVIGTENLPKEGPVVYMPNHQGYADIPVCCKALSTTQIGFVAKEELMKIPLYNDWIGLIRSVTIKRGDPRESLRAINDGINLVKNGFSLVVFPEGTRSRGNRQKDFKKGSMKLATKPGVPIVPVTINGTNLIFEDRGILTGNVTVDVTIHPMIETAGMSKEEQNNLAQRVQEIVESALPENLHYVPESDDSNVSEEE